MAMIAPQSRANTLKLVDEEEIRRLMEQLVGRVEKLEAAENNRVVSPKIYSFFLINLHFILYLEVCGSTIHVG